MIHVSAASLALLAGKYDEAERLIHEGCTEYTDEERRSEFEALKSEIDEARAGTRDKD
jgi:DNA-binding IclR family transcriptional regulator